MVTLRFCLYDFASSLEELNMKHRMLSHINHHFSDISLQCSSLNTNDEEIRFEFPKLYTNRDWITRKETIVWTNFGESLVLISQIHRKSFPLYSIIISQILKQYEMFTDSMNLCVHFNPWTHTDKIVDIDIPRYFPLNNPFLSYTQFNKERFQELFGCTFGNSHDSIFMSPTLKGFLSSTRNIFKPKDISIGRLHQRSLVKAQGITLPHFDPIMENLLEFLYEMCIDLSPLKFVVGTPNKDALIERDVFQLLVDFESPVLGFGDTNNPKFRNRLSTILHLLENEDDFNCYFGAKRRKQGETPIDNSDMYYLSQISSFIEMPSRLHSYTIKTNQKEKYLEASYKLKTEIENNDRFMNAHLLNYRRKIAENVKKLTTTTLNADPTVIRHILKDSITTCYRRDHTIGVGTHYATSILYVTNRSKIDIGIYKIRKALGF